MKKSDMIYMVQFGVAYEGIQSTGLHLTLEGAREAALKYIEEDKQDWQEYPCQYGGIVHWESETAFIEIIEGKLED